MITVTQAHKQGEGGEGEEGSGGEGAGSDAGDDGRSAVRGGEASGERAFCLQAQPGDAGRGPGVDLQQVWKSAEL